MRIFIIASLAAGQIATAQPAAAATFGTEPVAGPRDAGAFAGARLRLPLGGRAERVRAGLTIAPMLQTHSPDGKMRIGFGEGMEFGIIGRDRPALSIAGLKLRDGRLAAAQGEEKEKKGGGPSTLGVVGIVAGGLLVVAGIGFALYVDAANDASE